MIDSYSGYFWGNEPYDSSLIPGGRKTDEELKNMIQANLRKNNRINSSQIDIFVNSSAVTLTGKVKTYEEKRLAGKEAWNASGVAEVLNELEVTEPETAGPSRRTD